MANRHNQHIDSPAFKQLAYNALLNITPEQKETLSIQEREVVADKYTKRKFAYEQRMDEVLLLLAKLGISWTLRIEKDAYESDLVEFISHNQYQYPQKRMDVTDAASRTGTCVISSRDIMTTSHMIAQNTNSRIYAITEQSKELQKAGEILKKVSSWERDVLDASEAHDLANNILISVLNSFDYSAETLGLSDIELRILSALYKHKGSAVRLTDIADITKATGKKMYYRTEMARLEKDKFIDSDRADIKTAWANDIFFMITEKGIDKYLQYLKFVFSSAIKHTK